MLKIIRLMLYFLLFTACAQNIKEKTKNNFKEYVTVPNTRVSFPKSAFKIDKNIIGLIKKDKAVIQVIETQEDSFENQAKNFNNEDFEKKGGVILEKKDLKIANYQAKYMSVKTPDLRKLTMLLFGDDSFMVMLYGINNSIYDKTTDSEIEYLLSNFKYDKNIKITPLDSAPFIVDKNSEFKHANFYANVHFFTKSGSFSKGQDIKPLIVILSGAVENESEFDELFDFSIQMLEQKGAKIRTQIKKEKKIIGGYKAYEQMLELEINSSIERHYLLLLLSNNVFIQLQGKSDNEDGLFEIRNFGKTIRIKE